jgi:hypothetical protein
MRDVTKETCALLVSGEASGASPLMVSYIVVVGSSISLANGCKNVGCSCALWIIGCCLHSRPNVLNEVGCLDGSIVVATLAHELFQTFGSREAPIILWLTPGAVSLQCLEFYTYAIDECLCYVTRLTGSGH